MTEKLLQFTSTLILKIPATEYIPAFQEKCRVKKTIVRTVVKLLQTKQMELIYVGLKPDDSFRYDQFTQTDDRSTIISINVLNSYGAMCDFNTSQEMLLKRFKKELQSNSEQILIDKVLTESNTRCIEIYIKSRYFQTSVQQPNYTFAVSSGSYQQYKTAI